MPQLEALEIPTTHGFLEGLLRTEDAQAIPGLTLAALVCHPHPQGGGTMHNKVVVAITRALNTVGVPALRFNFRGVGRSTGRYDDGRGEREDVRAALDWLAARYPRRGIVLAGFSFGSWVGLPVGCADARVTQLIGVGVPVRMLTIASLGDCAKPKLIIQGGDDEYGPRDALLAWYADVAAPKALQIVAGATHFFPTHLDEVGTTISAWLRTQIVPGEEDL